jgi:hypothetical protein
MNQNNKNGVDFNKVYSASLKEIQKELFPHIDVNLDSIYEFNSSRKGIIGEPMSIMGTMLDPQAIAVVCFFLQVFQITYDVLKPQKKFTSSLIKNVVEKAISTVDVNDIDNHTLTRIEKIIRKELNKELKK